MKLRYEKMKDNCCRIHKVWKELEIECLLSMLTFVPLFWFGCGRQQKRHAAAPPPAGVQRRMERNRQKLVG